MLINHPTKLKLSIFVLIPLIWIISCQQDPCENVFCNEGTCEEGICQCPPGFTGQNCETALSIQQRLNDGKESPIELYEQGISLDSLYGKFYEGGLIFYLDIDDQIPTLEGMVAAPVDQDTAIWGCYPVFTAANDLSIGSGFQNTQAILEDCSTDNTAARICMDLELNGKKDWFLPSKEELMAMYENLNRNGYGDFLTGRYWSSSEVGFNFSAWAIPFGEAFSNPMIDFKENIEHVRAVRNF
jgi:hypothetical protein